MNAFEGKLEEKGFEFCMIDYFVDDESLETTKAFFLSHFHTDHMEGIKLDNLSSLFQKYDDTYFYCSEITKRFMENNPEINIPSDRIYVLEKDAIYITHNDVCVKVTPMRAGHCPGSLMFLFESYGGCVLYTGDFRLSIDDLKKMDSLHKNDQVLTLNNLYLDTTFADPHYGWFPDRENSFQIIREIIVRVKKLKNNDYTVILPVAHVGIEYLMVELNKAFNKKIHVSDFSFYRFHSSIQSLENIITTDLSLTDIHFCKISRNCDNCPFKVKNRYKKILKIKPSAQYFDVDICTENKCYLQEDELYYRVAYSSHCSLDELCDFVRYLNPVKIHPLVVPKNGYISKELIIEMVRNWKV